jgi:hypothetical protein
MQIGLSKRPDHIYGTKTMKRLYILSMCYVQKSCLYVHINGVNPPRGTPNGVYDKFAGKLERLLRVS